RLAFRTAPASLENDCTICAHKRASISWLVASHVCQEISCSHANTLPGNGSDKNQPPALSARGRQQLLSIRSDTDRLIRSGPDVRAPGFLRLRGDLAVRDIASSSIPMASESNKP